MFDGLAQYILDSNTYFDEGFEDVYKDDVLGIVHNEEPVFPADNFGNYFYLRLPNNVNFSYTEAYAEAMGENKPAKVYNLVLVACVRNADPEVLLDNLIVTLSNFKHDVNIQQATIQGNVVINEELSNMSADNREAALKRKPADMTIVSLSFSFSQITLINCIQDPCKVC